MQIKSSDLNIYFDLCHFRPVNLKYLAELRFSGVSVSASFVC